MKKTLGLMVLSLGLCAAMASSALAQSHLRIGLAEDPDVLDPTLARTYVGRIVFAGLCDKLFDINEKLEIVPQLASFGHGWGLLKHEELKELRHAGSAGQFSPCCEKTYEVFRTLYNELMEAFPQSKLFHVGFDEVGGCDPGHLWNFSDDLRCRQALCVLGDEGQFAGIGEVGISTKCREADRPVHRTSVQKIKRQPPGDRQRDARFTSTSRPVDRYDHKLRR